MRKLSFNSHQLALWGLLSLLWLGILIIIAVMVIGPIYDLFFLK